MSVMATQDFTPGGFRFIRGVFQYSSGVASLDGFRIERARFRRPLALADGLRRIEAFLVSIGRPTTARFRGRWRPMGCVARLRNSSSIGMAISFATRSAPKTIWRSACCLEA